MLLWWRHSLLLGIAYSIRKPLIALETVGFNQLIFFHCRFCAQVYFLNYRIFAIYSSIFC